MGVTTILPYFHHLWKQFKILKNEVTLQISILSGITTHLIPIQLQQPNEANDIEFVGHHLLMADSRPFLKPSKAFESLSCNVRLCEV